MKGHQSGIGYPKSSITHPDSSVLSATEVTERALMPSTLFTDCTVRSVTANYSQNNLKCCNSIVCVQGVVGQWAVVFHSNDSCLHCLGRVRLTVIPSPRVNIIPKHCTYCLLTRSLPPQDSPGKASLRLHTHSRVEL